MSARDGARRVLATYRDSGALWTASLVAERVLPSLVRRLWRDVPVDADTLAAQVAAILRAWTVSDADAAIIVEHLLWADLHGIDSHGCAMLRAYQRDLDAGAWTPHAVVEVVHESATTALVDGGGGLGHVPSDTAIKLAVAKCAAHGVAAVAVRNSGHFGAAGAYAALAARAGMIGLATTGTRVPAVVPTFGVAAMLGTNPIAFAAPAARNAPFLLDMATSTAPLGKLALAAHRGRAIPRGWALDRRGRAETNAHRAVAQRRLTPLGSTHAHGSHKGYGLATMVEILSAVLPGIRAGRGFPAPPDGVGHFFLALDPARFRPDGGFAAVVDALLDGLRATPPCDAAQSVRVAGDPEYAAEAERRRAGIPLARAVVEDIRHVARAAGAPFLLDASRRS